jgi:antitoxin YefM
MSWGRGPSCGLPARRVYMPHAGGLGLSSGQWLANCMAIMGRMRSIPLGEAKDKLSALVDAAESTHDIITITKHGRPAAVLMSADDLESLQETVFWLSQPGIRDTITAAEREYAEGSTVSGDALRDEFGLPPQ